VVQDGDGTELLTYHFYNGHRHWHHDIWGRPAMQIRKLLWGLDGWPLPGLQAGVNFLETADDLTGDWLLQVGFGQPASVSFGASGTISGLEISGEWACQGELAQLSGRSESGIQAESLEAAVMVDPSRQFFVGRDHLGQIVRGIKLDAKVGFL
jgi:hypothetical protein